MTSNGTQVLFENNNNNYVDGHNKSMMNGSGSKAKEQQQNADSPGLFFLLSIAKYLICFYLILDLIMMTPLKKDLDHTILRVERVQQDQLESKETNGVLGSTQNNRHVAGGQHQGIIVNKQLAQDASIDRGQFDLRLTFKVFLVNAITQIHQQESRELRFWFDENAQDEQDRLQCAQSFFRALVNPHDFPKTYVNFIMKLMKTMQQADYRPLLQIELEVKQIDEPFERPSSGRSCKYRLIF